MISREIEVGGCVTLTEHTEHDWSRGGGPGGELSPAVVHSSLGTGHIGEGKGGHRLCIQLPTIPEPSESGVDHGPGATRKVTTQVQRCTLRHIQAWLGHHTHTCRQRTRRWLGICSLGGI